MSSYDSLPLIKFCGIRRYHDVRVSYKVGANLLGFVFVRKSPRFVDKEMAIGLSRLAKRYSLITVGVFSDQTIQEIHDISRDVNLDFLQLHGNESPDFCHKIQSYCKTPVIKAISVSYEGDLELANTLDRSHCSIILLDRKAPLDAQYSGGHGVPFDWNILSSYRNSIPFILAGGINKNNICVALRKKNVMGIDVSSGIEYDKGSTRAFSKNHRAMSQFMRMYKSFHDQ